MSRRDRQAMANRAAEAASEAGRTLQAQRNYQPESAPEPVIEAEAPPEQRDEDDGFVERDPSKNPRNQAFEELVALRNPEPPAETPPETPPEAAPAAEEAAPAVDAPAADPEAPAPVKTVRVKVDGEEFDAPEDEVNEAGGIKPYQMLKASENRLKKTNEALAEARQQQAQIAQFLQQQANAAAQQRGPAKTASQEMQEKIDLIRYGSPEESAAAMQAMLDGQRVDPNQIAWQAISAIRQDDAEKAFVTEFSDVVHNPMLLKLIIAEKNERIAKAAQSKQPITDWNHFYRSIGNEVRGAIGRQSQPAKAASAVAAQTADPTSPVLSDKEARKASIVNLPTAAARAALPEADKPETRADVLNQMRKSRGLPTG